MKAENERENCSKIALAHADLEFKYRELQCRMDHVCQQLHATNEALNKMIDVVHRQADLIDFLNDDRDSLRSRVEELEQSWLSRALSNIRDFFKS